MFNRFDVRFDAMHKLNRWRDRHPDMQTPRRGIGRASV